MRRNLLVVAVETISVCGTRSAACSDCGAARRVAGGFGVRKHILGSKRGRGYADWCRSILDTAIDRHLVVLGSLSLALRTRRTLLRWSSRRGIRGGLLRSNSRLLAVDYPLRTLWGWFSLSSHANGGA